MISLLQLDGALLLTVLSIMLFAGLVHGTLGLGFPMVATPMLAVFFDVRVAILLTLLPTVAVNLASIYAATNAAATIRPFSPLAGFVLLGSLAGAYILANTDPEPFRLVLAGLILLYMLSHFFARIPREWLQLNKLLAMAVFGVLAGLSAGTTNVMVAVLIIYFLSLETPRSEMVPVLNTCFLIGKISQIAVLALAGFVSFSLLYETAPLAIAAIIALLFGQRIREKIAIDTYKKILQGLLVLLAGILVVQFYW